MLAPSLASHSHKPRRSRLRRLLRPPRQPRRPFPARRSTFHPPTSTSTPRSNARSPSPEPHRRCRRRSTSASSPRPASTDAATVTVTASQATGDDVLHLVDANGAQADVPIRVAFNAGTIVPQTTLKVTGEPADPDWLAQQVAASVARLTQAQPGARTTIGTITAARSTAATRRRDPVRRSRPDIG